MRRAGHGNPAQHRTDAANARRRLDIMPGLRRMLGLALLGLALSACSEPELILPGDRETIRPETVAIERQTVPALTLPPARRNADWTHVRGSTTHMPGHLDLGPAPQRLWSASIGTGDARRSRITAAPIVAEGRIYTLDAGAQVAAVSPSGQVLWRTDVTRAGEFSAEGFGGGLAYGDGALVVTTGFGEVLRLDPATGAILWRSAVDAAIRAAPTISDGRAVLVARSDIAYGFDLATGTRDWRVQGVGLGAGLLGGSSPAVRGPVAIIPFQSGEVIAVLARSGRRVWSAAVSGGRRDLVRARISDITGDPVIDFDIVYASSQSGRLVALDRRSGERLWTHQDGSYGPVLPIGAGLFMVSDIGEVLRLDAATGEVIWRAALPEWQRPDRRRDAIPHFGPLLAGGRLIVASGDGLLRSFDPATGAPLATLPIPGGAGAEPAIASGVLYIVSRTGELHAFQ